MLKEPADIVILEVAFDSKMTFEKHFRSVSRAASRKDWYLDIISREIQGFFKSLFDNVSDLIGQHSLYVLSTARARDSIAVVQ